VAEKEWAAFAEERAAGVAEIASLRQKAAEEDAQRKGDAHAEPQEADKAGAVETPTDTPVTAAPEASSALPSADAGGMDIDEEAEANRKTREASAADGEKDDQMRADDEDAVEY
jgi:hypothetical protein